MIMGSMLIFGTIGIFRRFIPLPSAVLACARGWLGAVVILVFLKLKGHRFRRIAGSKLSLLILSGVLMGANWIFLFEAYNYTTVAIATLCYYMQPTIVILLSPIIFRESLSAKKIAGVIISLVGMVLVSGVVSTGGESGANLSGIAFGLIAAALYSSVVIINKAAKVEEIYEKTVIQLLSAAVVLMPYLIAVEDFSTMELTPFSVAMILTVGIIHTGIAYVMYFGAVGKLPVQSAAIISYLDPVSALVLSFVILREPLSPAGLVGAVMIIAASRLF